MDSSSPLILVHSYAYIDIYIYIHILICKHFYNFVFNLLSSFVIRFVADCSPMLSRVAARGLDIQGVEWVLQLDCPEDVNTYIHRVGRTARCRK